jgi:hypothetical protein
MGSPVLLAHFARLKARYQDALLSLLSTGASLVTVPSFALPAGWPVPQVTLRFLAPNGYPVAAPDCFWVEPSLNLNGGGLPRNSQHNNAIPGANFAAHWFSWHVEQGKWSANDHDLMTWLGMCHVRLQTVA